MTSRIDAIRTQLSRQRSRAIQQSLFYRRGDRAADREKAALADIDAALLRRQLTLDATVPPDGVSARLVAIWPLERR